MAINNAALAGTAYISVDGVTLMAVGSFAYKVSKVDRTSLVGQDAVHGYSEKPIAPYISGTIRDSAGLSVASLNDMTDVTVVLELANKKIIVGRNMWTVDSQEAKTEDGSIDVKWEGPDVSEQ